MVEDINNSQINNGYKVIYTFEDDISEIDIRGANDLFLKAIESFYKTNIIFNFPDVLSKEIIPNINIVFYAIEMLIKNKIEITINDINSILNNVDENNIDSIISLYLKKDIIYTTINGKTIYPKTLNQRIYVRSLEDNDICFAIGPAGTGKTFLAVMFALKCLKSYNYRRIVLVRPIVEAGEKLGFLPGDFKDKVDPYLIPIYDNLYDAMGKEAVEKLIEKGTIEVAPLAYMRGRTLDNSIIILDEAQNATQTQMKMFLTRLGFNSKMIITGDLTQIDLVNKTNSGLLEAAQILDKINGIKIIKFQKEDVMRHPLVFKIIERYESKYDN